MQRPATIVFTGEQCSSGQGTSVKPLFADEGRECRSVPQAGGAGVGLLLYRSVDDQVLAISAIIDSQLLDMETKGYVRPVKESEVGETLDEIRRTGELVTVPQDSLSSLKVTCTIPKVGQSPPLTRSVSKLISRMLSKDS